MKFPNMKIQTAEERGIELMSMSLKNWPGLALRFTQHLGKRHGIHDGVYDSWIYMTGATIYAQCIEGLTCSDSLYKAKPSDREWFETKM